MIKTLCRQALLLLLGTLSLQADMVGGEISVGLFSHQPDGKASYLNAASFDLENDLHWDTEEDIVLKAYIEHPLPFVPNIKAAYSDLSHEGAGSIYGFNWGDIIDFSGHIDDTLDLKMYDLTLYYELLDNMVEADLGLTLRYLDGAIDVAVTPFSAAPLHATYEAVDFTEVVPMLYGKVRANIPATDVSLQFEGNIFSYDDTTLFDYELSARYTFTFGLGLEAGYRFVHLDSTDLEYGLDIDVDFKGPFATLVWDF
jgi:outer membrane protein